MKKPMSVVCALFFLAVVFPGVALPGSDDPLRKDLSIIKLPYLGEQIDQSVAVCNDKETQFTMEESKIVEAGMTDAIMPPSDLNVQTEGWPSGQALFTWAHNSEVDIHTFRYDDGKLVTQIGYIGDKNSILGAVHHNDASLNQISWYLTGEGGPHNFVKIWVLGLDEDGAPNREDIIYTADNVSNTDNQWSSYSFEPPLELTNGFFIGASYDGFLGIGMDDGVGAPWEFQPGTQFGIFDITDDQYDFIDLDVMGIEQNLLIRGIGLNHGDVNYAASQIAEVHGPLPILIELDEPVQTSTDIDRSFLGFDVFLDGEEVASDILQNEWLFAGLDGGTYEAGVRSVYTTGASEIVAKSFEMPHQEYDVTFAIHDHEGEAINDAVVTFDGFENPPGDYVFEDIGPGTYQFVVARFGYEDINDEITIDGDMTIEVEMSLVELNIVFNVNITPAIEAGLLAGFDINANEILMTGGGPLHFPWFNWVEPGQNTDQYMELVSTDPYIIYSKTLVMAPGEYQYRYFSDLIGVGWGGIEWPGDDNRMISIVEDMVVDDIFGGDYIVSVNETDFTTFNLYPNPASSMLNVESNAIIKSIRMIDLLGQVVYAYSPEDSRHEINVSGLRNGVYFIKISTAAGATTQRIQVYK